MSTASNTRAPTISDRILVSRPWWYLPALGLGVALARWGLGTRAFLLVAAVGAIGLLWVPGWVWAIGALCGALLSRLFTSAGFLPSIVNFSDFGFVVVGLAAVVARRAVGRPWTATARRLGLGLLLLFGVTWLSWAMDPSDLARPVVTFLLWAEPFALILMLLIDPPNPEARRIVLWIVGVIIALQVGFGLYQASATQDADFVKGTLIGTGAGHHVMAGITALAGLCLLAWGFGRSLMVGLVFTVLAAPLLILMPVLADAKQVIFALPAAAAILVLTTPGVVRRIAVASPLVAAVAVLIVLVPAGTTAVSFLESASEGESGKLSSVHLVTEEMGSSVSRWALGLGPANGVSRAAFMTTDLFLRGESPVRALGLEQAELPVRAQAQALQVAEGTSFNAALSSALGVFSDIGVLGVAAYASVLAAIALPLLRRRKEWLPRAALAGWALSLPLAVTFDWWEQPPFMLVLAVITGLALSARPTERRGVDAHPGRS
jgi:hypothetical protein